MINNEPMAYKLLIRELLSAKNMSMRHLSQVTGISPASISNILNGKQNASLQTLEQIADALDVQVYDLFDNDRLQVRCPCCGKVFHLDIHK